MTNCQFPVARAKVDRLESPAVASHPLRLRKTMLK